MPRKLSDDLISAAIEGFEAQKRRLDEQIRELRAMLPQNGASAGPATPTRGPRKRRRMSADARRRIAEAQRKRWAAIRNEGGASASMKRATKPRRKLSAAGRKRIIEANRKRWAATRGASVRTAGA
jgi:cell division septum initiation protein DivIVA